MLAASFENTLHFKVLEMLSWMNTNATSFGRWERVCYSDRALASKNSFGGVCILKCAGLGTLQVLDCEECSSLGLHWRSREAVCTIWSNWRVCLSLLPCFSYDVDICWYRLCVVSEMQFWKKGSQSQSRLQQDRSAHYSEWPWWAVYRYRLLDEEECEEFTDVYWLKFAAISNARYVLFSSSSSAVP